MARLQSKSAYLLLMGQEGHHHEGTSCLDPLQNRGGDINDVKGHIPAHLRDTTQPG